MYRFIGPPLWDSFEYYYGFSKEEAKTAVEILVKISREHISSDNKNSYLTWLRKTAKLHLPSKDKSG
jgi:hypothetical protein